jgi:hypothetical protein
MRQETFLETWDGVLRTIAKENFVAVVRRRKKQHKSTYESAVAMSKNYMKFLF